MHPYSNKDTSLFSCDKDPVDEIPKLDVKDAAPEHFYLLVRVATVREKSGKNKNFSRSGKSRGIL